MKDLKLSCDWYESDFVTITESETGKVFIGIEEGINNCLIILGKGEAAHLRDWLNEFLGESK